MKWGFSGEISLGSVTETGGGLELRLYKYTNLSRIIECWTRRGRNKHRGTGLDFQPPACKMFTEKENSGPAGNEADWELS